MLCLLNTSIKSSLGVNFCKYRGGKLLFSIISLHHHSAKIENACGAVFLPDRSCCKILCSQSVLHMLFVACGLKFPLWSSFCSSISIFSTSRVFWLETMKKDGISQQLTQSRRHLFWRLETSNKFTWNGCSSLLVKKKKTATFISDKSTARDLCERWH